LGVVEASTESSRTDAAPPPSRSRAAAWGLGSLLVYTLLTTVTGLAITPIIVRMLGQTRFGAVRMILDYGGYLALLELGLGGTLGPLLAKAAGRRDEPALRGTMAAGVGLYGLIALAIVAIGGALAPWVGRLVPVPPAMVGEVRLAWLIAVGGYLLLVLSPFRALADARQRSYRINLLMTGQVVVMSAAALLFATHGGGAPGQVLALVLANATVAFALLADGLARHPGLLRSILTTRPSGRVWRSLWALSPVTLMLNICGRVGLLTDYIIVGNILVDGPRQVTALFLTQRLAVLAQGQLQGIGSVVWAGLAELHARGDRELFRRRVVELTRLVAILGVAGLAPIVAYNHAFFNLWVPSQKAEYAGPVVLVVAATNSFLLGLTSLWGFCFSGTAKPRVALPAIIAATALNVTVSVAATALLQATLGPRAALVGPLLGTTTGLVGVLLWAMPMLLRRTFDISPAELADAIGRPLFLGLPYAAGLVLLARRYPLTHWPALFAAMGLAVAGFLLLAWAFLLTPDDRLVWRHRLAIILPWLGRG
jgi:O-antigen/teichoic acid export membrane protein